MYALLGQGETHSAKTVADRQASLVWLGFHIIGADKIGIYCYASLQKWTTVPNGEVSKQVGGFRRLTALKKKRIAN